MQDTRCSRLCCQHCSLFRLVTDIISTIDTLPNESPAPELIVDMIRSWLDNRDTNQEPVSPVCKLLIDDLQVSHVSCHKLFSVADPVGMANSVRLFPKETCTCPVNSTCCHIMAAKKSIGLETAQRRTLCLTQLRKNSRLYSNLYLHTDKNAYT